MRVAVDGGGSKTVAAVVDPKSGAVLAQFEGAGCRYNILGIDGAVAVVNEAVTSALAECATREDQVEHASLFLTMIDFPEDREAWHSALAKHLWAQGSIRVDNDIFALLRSGTSSDNAAAVVCGTGMNGIAVRHDGARATLAALGRTSGDFGGGAGLAAEILWHAARADDGRGPETALRDALLGWTGASDMESLYRMIRFDGLNPEAWMDQTRDLFAIADAGDAVAIGLLVRQGEEIGIMAASLLSRLELNGSAVPVVVGGGVASSGHPLLMNSAAMSLAAACPNAVIVTPVRTPIAGAIDLAVEHAAVDYV